MSFIEKAVKKYPVCSFREKKIILILSRWENQTRKYNKRQKILRRIAQSFAKYKAKRTGSKVYTKKNKEMKEENLSVIIWQETEPNLKTNRDLQNENKKNKF